MILCVYFNQIGSCPQTSRGKHYKQIIFKVSNHHHHGLSLFSWAETPSHKVFGALRHNKKTHQNGRNTTIDVFVDLFSCLFFAVRCFCFDF